MKLNQKGQSSVEYLLIVAVLVVAIFAFGDTLTDQLKKITGDAFGQIGVQLKNKIGSVK